MLADKVQLVQTNYVQPSSDLSHAPTTHVLKQVEIAKEILKDPGTARFEFTQGITDLGTSIVQDMYSRPEPQRSDYFRELMRNIVLPANSTWLEFPALIAEDEGSKVTSGKLGVLLSRGVDMSEVAVLNFREKVNDNTVGFGEGFRVDFATGAMTRYVNPRSGDRQYQLSILVPAVALLSIINSPRIAESVPSKLKNINERRAKKGKPLLLDHNIVRLTFDATGARYVGSGSQPKDTADEQHSGKRLHHVRAFIRTVKGKLQIVRPHWRGNAALGVVTHHYKADVK